MSLREEMGYAFREISEIINKYGLKPAEALFVLLLVEKTVQKQEVENQVRDLFFKFAR